MPADSKVVSDPDVTDDAQEVIDVTPPVQASAEDQLAAKIKADFEALYGPRLKDLETRVQNQTQAASRLAQDKERLQQEVAQLKSQAKPVAPVDAKDPWAGIENGQVWKSEIEKLAEQKADAKLQAWQADQRAHAEVQTHVQTQEASKRRVIARYPDLDPDAGNPDTPVSKAYVSVLAEHPDWIGNTYGPELAMYAMEEKLKANAPAASPGDTGKSRLATASLTPSRAPASSETRLTLTRQQKAFCDRHNMRYEDYAKTLIAAEQGVVEA